MELATEIIKLATAALALIAALLALPPIARGRARDKKKGRKR